jgi:nicotinamide-nucleotide amidase
LARIEMLAVGKELLIGRTMNSNAFWVGKRLARMGTMLKEVTTVDDDLGEIGSAFRAIVRRSPDFLVVVGGLGPTPDDMTLKGVAGALGVGLRKDAEAMRLMREHYAKRGLVKVEMTPARVKMATLPLGARPLRNQVGTAPGVRLDVGKTAVFFLPGVPAEMRSIFRASAEPEIRARVGKVHRGYVTLKLEGVPESALAPVLSDELRKHPGAYIKSHPRGAKDGVSRIELDIAVNSPEKRAADEEVATIAEEMKGSVEGLKGRVTGTRGQTTR